MQVSGVIKSIIHQCSWYYIALMNMPQINAFDIRFETWTLYAKYVYSLCILTVILICTKQIYLFSSPLHLIKTF